MLGALLTLVTPTRLILAGFIALGLYCSFLRNEVTHLELTISQKAEEQAKAAFSSSEKNAAISTELSDFRETQQTVVVANQDRNRDRALGFDTDVVRLRAQLGEFARSSKRANDTIAACSARTVALGELLADGVSIQARLADAAESNADSYRVMQTYSARVRSALK